MNYISTTGDVVVSGDEDVIVAIDPNEGDVQVTVEDEIGIVSTGDQGPPGPRGNSVLYGYGAPTLATGVPGDFYIDLRTALMYGPKTQSWPPGFSLIGPIGPPGPVGPQGPIGAPGNTIRNGSGPPDPSLGALGDFYIDTTNHIIYGPKNNSGTPWGTGTSLIGPQGIQGPVGPSGPPVWSSPPVPWATNTAYSSAAPASLVTNAGASYACKSSHISGVDFNTDLSNGLWALVASAGSPGQAIAQVYVGDTAPTGIQNSSLWWNSTDGCTYVYYFDGDSHQWVIASPVPDLAGYLPLAGGTMTGPLIQAADPVAALGTATKQYVDAKAAFPEAPNDGFSYGRVSLAWGKVVPLGGGTMTGLLTLSADPTATNHAATKHYVDANALTDAPADGFFYARQSTAWAKVVGLSGGTMTGLLTLSADPTASLGAATKQYADTKAPINSPNFTGVPTAPTVAVDDVTTKIASTQWVLGQGSAAADGTPAMDGTAARGTSTHWTRADHVHPSDTTRAPLASPVFTGNPQAPTPATADNTTSLATTAFVKAQGYLVNNATITLTGDVAGSGATAISTTLATVNANVGAFQGITVNGKGLVTGAVNMNYAPLASPTFTGTPAGPTPTANDNTTKLATTAFVAGQAATVNPAMNGTVAIGTSLQYARQDHVHPSDTTRAPLVSPGFTGNPTAPTPATADSSTSLATTAFVKAALGSGGAQVYISDTPPTGITAGSLWWESDTGSLFIYYNDGDSSQWVLAAPPTGAAANAVRYDIAQGLSTTQQQQAQHNIGLPAMTGVTDGSAAAAGQIGECLVATGYSVAASNGTYSNICSITLTPGDWDVSGISHMQGGPATVQTMSLGLSTTAGSIPALGLANTGLRADFAFGAYTSMYNIPLTIPPYRFSVTVNTTIYLVFYITANSGTATCNGRIQARRMR